MNVRLKGTGVLDFNTSYVTVQQKSSLVILIFKIISIHPMLRFNGCYKCYYDFISEFYGSTVVTNVIMILFLNFNTSYVTVQQQKVGIMIAE